MLPNDDHECKNQSNSLLIEKNDEKWIDTNIKLLNPDSHGRKQYSSIRPSNT